MYYEAVNDLVRLIRSLPRSLVLGLGSLLFTVACIACFHGHYTVNDDPGIVDFAIDGYPIPYVGMVFSNLLHLAYIAAPTLPWFGLMLYGLQTLGLWLWLVLGWRVLRRPWLALVFTLVVFGYYLGLIVSLDFTATSIMLCMVGVTWACIEVVEGGSRALHFVLPGLVFMLGMLVRPQGAPGTLAYALPLALVLVITRLREHAYAPEARRLGGALILFLLPAVINAGVDVVWRHAVLTPEEAQYDAFNKAATDFSHLSPARVGAIRDDRPLLSSLHWTDGDVLAFMHWRFLDERVYTPETMRTLVAHAPPERLTSETMLPVLMQSLPPGNMVFLLVIASLPLFLYLSWRRLAEGLIGSLLPVYCLGLTAFMYLFYAFHARLELPFEIGLGLAALLIAGLLAERVSLGGRGRFLAATGMSMGVALAGAGFAVLDTMHGQDQVSHEAGRTQGRLDMLNRYFAGDVVLLQPVSWDVYMLDPLKPVVLRFEPIELGWNTFSPRFYRQIGVLGIQHGYQLMDALAHRPGALVSGSEGWCQELVDYANSSGGGDFAMLAVGPNVFRIVDKRRGTAPARR